jgi:hypothetical protein
MKKRVYRITESQLKKIINESFYDSNKLYNKQFIENITVKAPREIKNIVRSLEVVGCTDRNGNSTQCVRIPEVLFVYINGRY